MSRGCLAGCSYCPYSSYYGKNIEYRSAEKIVQDIKNIVSLGIKDIVFRDQYFGTNRIVLDVLNTITALGINISWCCETRLESLDGNIDIMIKSCMNKYFWCRVIINVIKF